MGDPPADAAACLIAGPLAPRERVNELVLVATAADIQLEPVHQLDEPGPGERFEGIALIDLRHEAYRSILGNRSPHPSPETQGPPQPQPASISEDPRVSATAARIHLSAPSGLRDRFPDPSRDTSEPRIPRMLSDAVVQALRAVLEQLEGAFGD